MPEKEKKEPTKKSPVEAYAESRGRSMNDAVTFSDLTGIEAEGKRESKPKSQDAGSSGSESSSQEGE